MKDKLKRILPWIEERPRRIANVGLALTLVIFIIGFMVGSPHINVKGGGDASQASIRATSKMWVGGRKTEDVFKHEIVSAGKVSLSAEEGRCRVEVILDFGDWTVGSVEDAR